MWPISISITNCLSYRVTKYNFPSFFLFCLISDLHITLKKRVFSYLHVYYLQIFYLFFSFSSVKFGWWGRFTNKQENKQKKIMRTFMAPNVKTINRICYDLQSSYQMLTDSYNKPSKITTNSNSAKQLMK